MNDDQSADTHEIRNEVLKHCAPNHMHVNKGAALLIKQGPLLREYFQTLSKINLVIGIKLPNFKAVEPLI